MSRSMFVLCQDCLKVSIYSDARHNEDELCSCGGQFCGCSFCNAEAKQIVADDKNHVLHGLSDSTLFELSEA
ncbi:hypothetical protein ATG66_2478 [Vibrio sp. ES.051]|uniref:hypothetical protein n=1 Tax=Vibrio sp. ES.051 TaxID=1761909 RepID=UPI000BF2D334|nr:hypothetical protein [Vibrio sp. ES.051]PFG56152.1 hypothetical protein ATG66_2478 [Vibrio sp. ES.051]